MPPTIVLAIFGRETDYGSARDKQNAIRVLATQAYLGKRKEKFLDEFLQALKILDEGQVKLADMTSSWAGAMGLTQFMPSDYVKYAVDFDGDGRPNIWTSVPDALASAAKQLQGKGWQRGLRWAYEVHPPANVDCTIGVPDNTLPIGEWLKRGYVPAYGRTLSAAERAETASLLQPAGLYGPSFLVTKNYFVIKEYNFSDLYVLFVGHLCRSHHRPAAVRDAVEQGRATADRRARPYAAHPHRPRLLSRQDRRQGRHADPLSARRLSEAQWAEGRLLADGGGVGAYGSQQELTKSDAVSTMRAEPTMQIKAAVVSERSGPFAIETVELCEPRPDEVIVRVVASGMCQTDLHGRDGYFDSPYPAVYGHEGAGVVHAVGNAVRGLRPATMSSCRIRGAAAAPIADSSGRIIACTAAA